MDRPLLVDERADDLDLDVMAAIPKVDREMRFLRRFVKFGVRAFVARHVARLYQFVGVFASASCWLSSQRSASMAALQPDPAAVTAWR